MKTLILALVLVLSVSLSYSQDVKVIFNATAFSNSTVNASAGLPYLGNYRGITIGITTTTAAEYDNISFDFKAPGSSTWVAIDSIATFALGTAGANWILKAVRNTVVDKYPFVGGQCRVRMMHKSSGNTTGTETVRLYLSR
jgi:hypothetical protein